MAWSGVRLNKSVVRAGSGEPKGSAGGADGDAVVADEVGHQVNETWSCVLVVTVPAPRIVLRRC